MLLDFGSSVRCETIENKHAGKIAPAQHLSCGAGCNFVSISAPGNRDWAL